MGISINANQIYASIRDRGQTQADTWAGQARGFGTPNSKTASGHPSNSPTSVRSLEYQQRLSQKKDNSIIGQSQSYADALAASRTKSKETSLEKKRLSYNANKISSQIVRSKNSISARKAASSARRELLRLKRLRSSGEYDEEELQISIEHAKAMERIAKKKVSHLQQEEMIERGQKGALSGLSEKEEEKIEEQEEEITEEEELTEEELTEEEFSEEELESIGLTQEQLAQLMEEMQYHMEEMQELSSEPVEDSMSDLIEEISSEMAEMMEELDLSELLDTMVAPDPNMSEDDLKMLKIKHRSKEMKDIAQANGDYLKAIFEKYKKSGVAGMSPSGSSGSPAVATSVESVLHHTPTPVTVTLPQPYNTVGAGMTFNAKI